MESVPPDRGNPWKNILTTTSYPLRDYRIIPRKGTETPTTKPQYKGWYNSNVERSHGEKTFKIIAIPSIQMMKNIEVYEDMEESSHKEKEYDKKTGKTKTLIKDLMMLNLQKNVICSTWTDISSFERKTTEADK